LAQAELDLLQLLALVLERGPEVADRQLELVDPQDRGVVGLGGVVLGGDRELVAIEQRGVLVDHRGDLLFDLDDPALGVLGREPEPPGSLALAGDLLAEPLGGRGQGRALLLPAGELDLDLGQPRVDGLARLGERLDPGLQLDGLGLELGGSLAEIGELGLELDPLTLALLEGGLELGAAADQLLELAIGPLAGLLDRGDLASGCDLGLLGLEQLGGAGLATALDLVEPLGQTLTTLLGLLEVALELADDRLQLVDLAPLLEQRRVDRVA